MKKTRRWLALLLAVILVGSNALYQIGTSMSASETETTAESGQQDDSAAVPETQDQDTASLDQQKDTGGVQVQEVTPQTQQEQTNSQSEAAKTQQVQPAQNNTSASDQNTQAVPGTEPAQETPEEKTYHVTIQKSDVDGGTIKAWGADGNKADVTYNSENKYVKEVKEGEEFNFEITAKDTYKVAKVTDQNGNVIAPETTEGNVTTYKLSGVAEEKAITITYNKVETPAEDVPEQETSGNHSSDSNNTENKETTVIPNGTTSENSQNESILATDENEKKSDENIVEAEPVEDTKEDSSLLEKFKGWFAGESTKTVSEQNTVTVGQTIKLNGTSNSSWYCNYSQEWKSKDTNIATVSNDGTVKGVSAGKVTISHKYCTASHMYNRKSQVQTPV